MSKRRVLAIYRKELREYRRHPVIVLTMALLPLIFLIQPAIIVFSLPPTSAPFLVKGHLLLWLLAIPALTPGALASYAVVGERQQGTLEPVLTTPVRREEFLVGKALAAFVPSVGIGYAIYAIFLACVAAFARPEVAPALLRGPDIFAQVVFTPLIAAWSIWVGMGFSVRSSDVRTAQQLATVANLPVVAVTSLIAFGVIPASVGLALGLGVALLVLDGLGWRVISATFNGERLITG